MEIRDFKREIEQISPRLVKDHKDYQILGTNKIHY